MKEHEQVDIIRKKLFRDWYEMAELGREDRKMSFWRILWRGFQNEAIELLDKLRGEE